MNDASSNAVQEGALEQIDSDAQETQGAGRRRDSIDLVLRFLVGLLALGGDEAARRLQEMQSRLDADPTLWSTEGPADHKTIRRQAWHLGVGLARRGNKRLRRSARRAYERSLRTSGRVATVSRRLGAGRLTRPLRGPIETRLARWRKEAALIQIEGELEERKGRALATGTLAALILEIMDEVAQNPELLDFVQHLLSQQGRGMATSVVDNTRSVTLTADDAAEGLLRWLLRRTPRGELPPSPVEGQPQTMYEPTARVDAGAPNVE
jgi:hypothetical protein